MQVYLKKLMMYLLIIFFGEQVFSAEYLSVMDFHRITNITSADHLSHQYEFHLVSQDGTIETVSVTQGDDNYKSYLRYIEDLKVGDASFFRQMRILNGTARDSQIAEVIEEKVKYFLEIPFATLKHDISKVEYNNIPESDLVIRAFVHLYKKDWAKARFLHRLLEADRFSYTRGISFSLKYNNDKAETLFGETIEDKLFSLTEKLTEKNRMSQVDKQKVQLELVGYYFSFKGLGISSISNWYFAQMIPKLDPEYKQMILKHYSNFLKNPLDSNYSDDEIRSKARSAIDFFVEEKMKLPISYAKVVENLINIDHTLIESAIKLIQLAPPEIKKELLMSLLRSLYENWQYTSVFSDYYEQVTDELKKYSNDPILVEYNRVRSHGDAVSISQFVKEHFPTFEKPLKNGALSCSKVLLN